MFPPWNVAWLGFASWVDSYANEWEDHPSFDSALELSCYFWVCSLQMGDFFKSIYYIQYYGTDLSSKG